MVNTKKRKEQWCICLTFFLSFFFLFFICCWTEVCKVSWNSVWLSAVRVIDWKHDQLVFLWAIPLIFCVPLELGSHFYGMWRCLFTLKDEEALSLKRWYACIKTTRHHISEYLSWQQHESLKRHIRNCSTVVGVRYRNMRNWSQVRTLFHVLFLSYNSSCVLLRPAFHLLFCR
jgi:hypothetical protein